MKEWLVTDGHGAFAMGTETGVRTRKYHGFFMNVPGRSTSALFLDLEIECCGHQLWPHCYSGQNVPVFYPDPKQIEVKFSTDPYVHWKWKLPEGELEFSVTACLPRGIQLAWKWLANKTTDSQINGERLFRVRPFIAGRDIHSTGGDVWRRKSSNDHHGLMQAITDSGHTLDITELCDTNELSWLENPHWYRSFFYQQEAERGYPANEDLFSSGEWRKSAHDSFQFTLQLNTSNANQQKRPDKCLKINKQHPIMNFVLNEPPGIVAGFPWFGEWGRDTFISLPGIVAARIQAGEDPKTVMKWATHLLKRWSAWVSDFGMLPNLIEPSGEPQWESADGTLWWCHSLAALWQISLGNKTGFEKFVEDFSPLLKTVIRTIKQGRHRFLQFSDDDGLLIATCEHGSWMDARVHGKAVTPRLGKLPEINALWFQAQCLDFLWDNITQSLPSALVTLGKKALQCGTQGIEKHRPNRIFFHSLPLAPSFVLNNHSALEQDMSWITACLWTPVGLRTLDPDHPHYHKQYLGSQEQRDNAYHQGTAWGWLGGHYEMALARLNKNTRKEMTFPSATLAMMPIQGHIVEVFDPELPFTPRGAPAQAWSLACFEEAKARQSWELDLKLSDLLVRHR